MHSSRMHTARFSGCLGGGRCLPWEGGVCLGDVCLGVYAQGGLHPLTQRQTPPAHYMLEYTTPLVDRRNDTRL